MTAIPNAIPITIVSKDTALLRELAWFLATFGYEVSASNDLSEEAAWKRQETPGILLIDGRSPGNGESVLAVPRGRQFLYRICLYSAGAKGHASKLLKRGAEDVLQTPVSRGELLARLRVGARRLEFERRLLGRSTRDGLTGLYTRAGLIRWLEQLDAERSGASIPEILVLSGIDWSELIRTESGQSAFQHLVNALVAGHANYLSHQDAAAVLGDGVVGGLLRGRSLSDARSFAESVATDFSAQDTVIRKTRSLPTISSTIQLWEDDVTAVEFIERSLSTFSHVYKYAESSIVEADEIDQEVRHWRNAVAAGNPFAGVVAQDIIEAFPIALQSGEQTPAWASGGDDCPPCLPMVDGDGHFVGMMESSLAACSRLRGRGSLPTADPNAIAHNAPLVKILQRFRATAEDHLVVFRDERPVGYITRDDLANLIDPVTSETYRRDVSLAAPASSFVVPCTPCETELASPVHSDSVHCPPDIAAK